MTSSSYPVETNNGTATTWVPLTSTFSAPQSCTTIFRDIGANGGGTRQAYDPNYTSLDKSYSCVAAPVSVWWSQYSESSATYTTKIAIGPLVCPGDWSVVQTSVKDKTSTLSMCCPSGYDRSNGANAQAVANIDGVIAKGAYGVACVSTVTAGQVLRVYTYTGTTVSTVARQTTVFAVGVIGMNIGTASSTSTISSITSTSASNTPTTTTSSDSSGLSTGAKAGIGVGSALVALGLIALIAFFVLRSKKGRGRVEPPIHEKMAAPMSEQEASRKPLWPHAELESSSNSYPPRHPYELDGSASTRLVEKGASDR